MQIKDFFIKTRKPQIDSYVIISTKDKTAQTKRYSHYRGDYFTAVSDGSTCDIKYYDTKEYLRELKIFAGENQVDLHSTLYSLVFYKTIYSGRGKRNPAELKSNYQHQQMLQFGWRVFSAHVLNGKLTVRLRGIDGFDWSMDFNAQQIKNQITSLKKKNHLKDDEPRIVYKLILKLIESGPKDALLQLIKTLNNYTSTLSPDYCIYYYNCLKELKLLERTSAHNNNCTTGNNPSLPELEAQKQKIKHFFSLQPQISSVNVKQSSQSVVIKQASNRQLSRRNQFHYKFEFSLSEISKSLNKDANKLFSLLTSASPNQITALAQDLYDTRKQLLSSNGTIYRSRPDYRSVLNQI
jgi:hypothetical protein